MSQEENVKVKQESNQEVFLDEVNMCDWLVEDRRPREDVTMDY